MSSPILLTTAPVGSPDWLKARAGLVTASTAASILCPGEQGVFGTPLTEYARIRAELEGQAIDALPDDEPEGDESDDDESEATTERDELRWGNITETSHRDALEKACGLKLEPPPGVFRDASLAWLAATPDGYALCPEAGRGVLELKAPTRFGAHKWHLGPPLGYVVQIAVQMRVMQLPWGILSALIPPSPRWQRMYADPVMEEWMLTGLTAFWENHVMRDIPPSATGSDKDLAALRALWPVSTGRQVILPPESREHTEKLLHARAMMKDGKALEKEAKAALIPMMQDAERGILPGNMGVLTYKSSPRNNKAREASVSIVRKLAVSK